MRNYMLSTCGEILKKKKKEKKKLWYSSKKFFKWQVYL